MKIYEYIKRSKLTVLCNLEIYRLENSKEMIKYIKFKVKADDMLYVVNAILFKTKNQELHKYCTVIRRLVANAVIFHICNRENFKIPKHYKKESTMGKNHIIEDQMFIPVDKQTKIYYDKVLQDIEKRIYDVEYKGLQILTEKDEPEMNEQETDQFKLDYPVLVDGINITKASEQVLKDLIRKGVKLIENDNDLGHFNITKLKDRHIVIKKAIEECIVRINMLK